MSLPRSWILGSALLSIPTQAQESVPKRTPVGRPIPARPVACSRVRGIVHLGEWGRPATEVTLRLLGEGFQGSDQVPLESGRLEIPVEGDGGRFAWALWAPGHDPVQRIVDLQPDRTVDLGEVLLPRGSGVLAGRVTDVSGGPVCDASVRLDGGLVPAPPNLGRTEWSGRTDSDGRFRIEGLPAGRGYVRVSKADLPAIPAWFVEMRPWESHWLDLAPVVGTLEVSVRCDRGRWDEGFTLALEDQAQRLRILPWIEPPRAERSRGFRCGGCRATFLSRGRPGRAIVLEPALPGAELFSKSERPWVSGGSIPAEIHADASGGLLRNVPAGTWRVLGGKAGAAEPAQVVVPPGGHARLAIRLP